jgi:hypothetical protein
VEIYHSTDLIHWERFSRVVDPAWSGLASSIAGGGTWGGFIVKIPGGYRAYFAVRFGQYFAHAASLAGPWDAPVQVNSFGYLGTFSQSALPTPSSAYTAAAPAGSVVWLKIVRAAHQATGWFSSDGLGWTQAGTSLDISALDDNPSLGNTWVSNQAGIFASNKSADFDFFAYRDGFTDIPAVKPDQHSGATAVTSSAKGTVLSFKNGDWALYGSVELGSGGLQSQGIELTVASAGNGAEVEVWTDPLAGGDRIATCTAAGTGGWEAWQTASCPLAATGMHEVSSGWWAGPAIPASAPHPASRGRSATPRPAPPSPSARRRAARPRHHLH